MPVCAILIYRRRKWAVRQPTMRTRGEGDVDEGTDEEYTGNKSDGDGAAVNASGHSTTRTLCRGIWVLKGRWLIVTSRR